MIELKELDPAAVFQSQLLGPDNGRPMKLVNTFVAPAGDTAG
ncbi:hypothetical protein [Streptomyces sp. NBC_00878]|nr:hypothetical protein [Streptomyces sp. NBC_00878]MCX4904663.1 hypothetical protein [Streptomyces sp. NBC_00878]